MTTLVRRLVPYSLLPLALLACMLANSMWLRAFPSDVIAVPVFGAAAMSVLIPMIVVGIGLRPLWIGVLIDAALLVVYELVVTLREPAGFDQLYSGLVHGPAQILSFAFPLAGPRTLLVAPVALCWLCGALVGEYVARGWHSVLPYLTLLIAFGLAYAGTARAVTSSADGRRYDTLLAAALLLTLLLLRGAQAWVGLDQSAETTAPEGVLPLRGLAIATVVAIGVTAAAAGAVQSAPFDGRAVTPARVPPIDQSRPLTPIAWVAGLRPDDPTLEGATLFTISTDRPTSNYISVASVDYYDGDSWTFSRTFRPSGGEIPADPDPAMRAPRSPVVQEYRIADGPMGSAPWMPHLDRAERITGIAVNIDETSGMAVPSRPLHAGDQYTVTSSVPRTRFDQLRKTALVATSAAQVDTTLPSGLTRPLATLIASLRVETGTSSDQPVAFLQAVAAQFRSKAALAGAPAPTSTQTPAGADFVRPSTTPQRSPTATPRPAPTPTGSPAPTPNGSPHTGGTTFADVLASIRASHSGTPEQFATLTALIARALNVPAVVVSGFRLPIAKRSSTLPTGTYSVMSGQAWTWVEIPIRGLGWVVLDAAPGTYSGQAPEPGTSPTNSPAPSPSPSHNALLTHSTDGGHAVAPHSSTGVERGVSANAALLIAVLAFVVAVLLFAIFLLSRKHVRVHRRRRGDPRRRLLGAWQESIDFLVEAGLPDLTYATSAEVAAHTEARFGAEPAAAARQLGTAANVAIFSPVSAVALADADEAWRTQATLRTTVRDSLGWGSRVRARLRYNRAPR